MTTKKTRTAIIFSRKYRGNFKSLQKWQKILVAICKWSVFGGYPVGSHAQTTISNSSTIFFQPNFAGLLKLPHKFENNITFHFVNCKFFFRKKFPV